MNDAHEPIPIALAVGSWLPYSETFIYDQLAHQRRFVSHVLARERVSTGHAFPYAHVTALRSAERLLWACASRAPRFERAARAANVQLVHAHFGNNGALSLDLAKRLRLPLVVSFHGHDVAGLMPKNRLTARYFRYQRLAPALFSYARLLLCASSELADLLLALGAPESRIRVHRLGVDLRRFQVTPPPNAARRLLMVGRLVEKKGMEFGLRAFAQLRSQRPDLTLTIVGSGPLRAALERQAQELGVADAVHFRGALAAEGVRAELARASLLLAPSVVARDGDRESGVIVLKEAAACGRPTVGTHHGGIPEIIDDGVTGFLVEERDVPALVDRVARVLDDPALALRMGTAARTKMERDYDTVLQNARLEEHLASAL